VHSIPPSVGAPRKSSATVRHLFLLAVCLVATIPVAPRVHAQTGATGSTTTLTSSGGAPSYSLTATVTGSGDASPTGLVSFIDQSNHNIVLGTATLVRSASWTAASYQASGNPMGLILGPDNNLYYADPSQTYIGQLTGGGTITEFVPPGNIQPVAVATGNFGTNANGSIVFVDATTDGTVGWMSTAGSFTILTPVSVSNTNGAIVVGPDSAWIGVATTAGIAILAPSNGNWSVAANISTDPYPDTFAVLNNGLAVGFCTPSGAGEVGIFTGSGTGLLLSQTIPMNACVKGLATGTFHGTSTDDLIASMHSTSATAENLEVLYDQGSEHYSAQPAFAANAANLNGVLTGDFNEDGLTDFAVASGSTNTVLIYYGQGDGQFSSPVTLSAGAGANAIALAPNFFGSDTSGLAVTNTSAPSVTTFQLGLDSATATATGVAVPGTGTHQIYASYGGNSTYADSQSTDEGLAAQLVPTRLSVAANPASISVGQESVLTATLTPSSYDSLSATNESVTFYNGTTSLGTATLTAGAASLAITTLPAGSDSITAYYAGDGNFSASTAAAVSVSVATVTGPVASLSPTSLAFNATSVGSSSATQAVTLSNPGSTALAVSSISASGPFSETNDCGSSVAAGGNCSINVAFAPTAAGAQSGTVTLADNASGSPQSVSLTGTGQSVGVTSSESSLTLSGSGGSATATITVASQSGFNGTVNLGCTVTYNGTGSAANLPTCSLNPSSAQVTGGGSVSSTLTVNTGTNITAAALITAPGTALAGLFVLGLIPQRRRRLASWSRCLVLAAAVGGLIGCGSSHSGSDSATTTTAGDYSVVVKATSGSVSTSTTIPLTVQ
jgi:hypothetical protein